MRSPIGTNDGSSNSNSNIPMDALIAAETNDNNDNDNTGVGGDEGNRRRRGQHRSDPGFEENEESILLLAQTEDVVQLFSTTLRSLAADAAAIRQITDIAELAGALPSAPRSSESKSSKRHEERSGSDNTDLAEALEGLDELVSGVEHKVSVLRQIINEENSALSKFETTLREEADEQAALIEGLMAALERKQRDTNSNTATTTTTTKHRHHDHHQQQQQQQQQRFDDDGDDEEESWFRDSGSRHDHGSNIRRGVLQARSRPASGIYSSPHPSKASNTRKQNGRGPYKSSSSLSSASPLEGGTFFRSNKNGSLHSKVVGFRENEYRYYNKDGDHYNHSGGDRDECGDNEEIEEDWPRFVPVTEEELSKQTRFGPHLSRYDVNEALDEIRGIVWKHIALESSSSSLSHHHESKKKGAASSASLQRRFDYLRQRQSNKTNDRGFFPGGDKKAHEGHEWVSEQELRENCAFFRHGESTARATLQLLCSLKRLKQVPGKKNTDITYICLF